MFVCVLSFTENVKLGMAVLTIKTSVGEGVRYGML